MFTYKETCTWKEFYIEETKYNSEVRWNEHCCLKKSSEVGDNLLVNPDHNITWQIIAKAPQASAHEKQGRATTARLVTKFRSHRCVAWKVARQPPGRRVVTCADYSF